MIMMIAPGRKKPGAKSTDNASPANQAVSASEV
jgi:hypothetical protein